MKVLGTLDARILAVLCLCGVGLVIAGIVVGHPSAGSEGAYFNRSAGVPAFSGSFAKTGPGMLDPSDGNLWLGAGIAVLVVIALTLVLTRHQVRGPLTD